MDRILEYSLMDHDEPEAQIDLKSYDAGLADTDVIGPTGSGDFEDATLQEDHMVVILGKDFGEGPAVPAEEAGQ